MIAQGSGPEAESIGEKASGTTVCAGLPATTNSLLIDRLIARIPAPREWVVLAIGAILLLVPLVLTIRDGIPWQDVLTHYRAPFIYPVIIVYLLTVFNALETTRVGVARALRPVILVEDSTYASIVKQGYRISPVGELTALGIGVVISLAITLILDPIRPGPFALEHYAYWSRIVMMSLDIWVVYVVFAMTRLTNTLLRQPVEVDVFDLTPFEPIGRQTVWLCLTVVGNMILGLLALDALNWYLLQEYLIFSASLVVFIVLLFYVNTHNVHRLIAAKKKYRLDAVGAHLARRSTQLEDLMASGESVEAVATEINALAVIKQELKRTRTWPYNTEMLRTIFISIVTPLAIGLTRVATAFLLK